MKLTWKPSKQEYVSGECLYAGSYKVATVVHDGISPRDELKRYVVYNLLPGMGSARVSSLEEGKIAAETSVNIWFANAQRD